MSAPAKPWEQDRYGGRVLNSSAPMSMLSNPAGRIRTGSPQLPPRPSSLSNSYGSSGYSSMGMYGPRAYSGYNSYSYGGLGGMGSYGGYGGYGSYGGYGYGGGMYNGYGGGMYGAESRFIQLAEESTRPAFQGIESLVRAFGSIAMMLDSTFFAVTSSFRAVLGVAENFGRIRSMFGQLWSSFALLRAINWMYRKFMSLLGVKIPADVGKQAWDQAIKEAGTEATQNVSSWPIFMFLGMIISAPYIISKLLPPILDKRNPENWTEPGMRAGVQYNFQASNSEELSMNKGDEIIIAPKSIQDEMNLTGTGWVFAASKTGTGLVPLNYLYPANKPPQTQTSMPMPDEQISDPRFLPAETIPNETRIFPKSTTTDAKKRVTFNDTILTNEETPLNPQEPPKVEVTNETAQNVPASSQNELNNTKNN